MTDEEIGKRLREERKYRGYSQEEIAEYLGVSRATVSQMENGNRKIKPTELQNLADLYEMPIDVLVEGTMDESNEDVAMLARTTKDLSDEDRREVLRFAQFLKSKERSRDNDG